ncbi:hypothetical protein DYGSA30_13920 [Dyella sp. GSA-30]|jgi:hypothetical protein|nr:hypothetical protein DYGSA30_13920 [Dyella sp. GSA-30]
MLLRPAFGGVHYQEPNTMQQFIPFEDEWDMLEKLLPESLIPYRVGVPCTHGLADTPAANQRAPLTSPLIVNSSPT